MCSLPDSGQGAAQSSDSKAEYPFCDAIVVELILAIGDLIAELGHADLVHIGELLDLCFEAPQVDGLRN